MTVPNDPGGSGPGDHPGVTIVPLTTDTAGTKAQLEAAYAAGALYSFQYTTQGQTFAVLVIPY